MTVPRPDLPIVLLSHRGQPRVLDQAEPAFQERQIPHRSAGPGRGRPPGSWPAMSRTGPCCGDSCTARRCDRVAAVVDQLHVRAVPSVPVQLDRAQDVLAAGKRTADRRRRAAGWDD
jgi:hypothetical protein